VDRKEVLKWGLIAVLVLVAWRIASSFAASLSNDIGGSVSNASGSMGSQQAYGGVYPTQVWAPYAIPMGAYQGSNPFYDVPAGGTVARKRRYW
jgi:hypothetical protein